MGAMDWHVTSGCTEARCAGFGLRHAVLVDGAGCPFVAHTAADGKQWTMAVRQALQCECAQRDYGLCLKCQLDPNP